MSKIILDQFNKFLKDVEEEHKADKTVFRESLFDRTCAVAASALEEIGKFADAKKIRQTRDEYRDK